MRPLKVLFLAAVCGFLVACNTVSGVGKDLKSGGEAITDTADDAKNEM